MWSSLIGSAKEVPTASRPGAGDDHRRQRAEPVALDHVGDHTVAVGAVGEQQRRGDERAREAERADGRGDDAPVTARDGHRAEQVDPAGREQRQRRARARTSRCAGWRGEAITAAACLRLATAFEAANERSVIAAGQADRTSRIATSGTTMLELGGPQVERRLGDRGPGRLVQHGRDQPQHVHRREHDRHGARDRVAPAGLEDAGQDLELTREGRGARHGERDHAGRHQHGRERRPAAGHPAERGQLTGRGAPLDPAGEQEERGGDQAVVDHLQHRASQAEAVDARTGRA